MVVAGTLVQSVDNKIMPGGHITVNSTTLTKYTYWEPHLSLAATCYLPLDEQCYVTSQTLHYRETYTSDCAQKESMCLMKHLLQREKDTYLTNLWSFAITLPGPNYKQRTQVVT